MSLRAMLNEKRLVVCVGSGGVGKTTTAAAMALQAARQGRRVLVLTIDPARRLANSLGMQRFGNDETRIDLSDLPGVTGELWAMMLDNRHTFDGLIGRVAVDQANRDAILGNRIYRAIADNIAGSQDYMATEKLYDVVESGEYDLVVLDTPPVKNALDFLDAPGRLSRFLDKRVMKWFLTPYDEGRVFGRLLMGTSAVVFRLLGYIFGREFLEELSEFFLHFRDLYDGFRDRHETVVRLFHEPRTAFVVVCAPNQPSVDVAGYFLRELEARKMPRAGLVVNQRHRTVGEVVDPEVLLGDLARDLAVDLEPHTRASLLARLGAAHRRMRELAGEEQRILDGLYADEGRGLARWEVPRLEDEVNDLVGLARIGRWLVGDPAGRSGS